MAVPKRRTSKMRKRIRRSSKKLKVPAMSVCPQCGEITRPHHACPFCGYYKGREVVMMEDEAE